MWAAADALRNNIDAAEYKHVFLGLIFLKYISRLQCQTRRATPSVSCVLRVTRTARSLDKVK
jgi:hypothetical protein